MADNFIARKNSEWIVVSLVPDVCKTPVGPSVVPIPYPVTAKLSAAVQEVPNVKANGCPLVVLDQSFIPTTVGDKAGVVKGIQSGTVEGNCYPMDHSTSVRAGKRAVLRHGDKFWMNGK